SSCTSATAASEPAWGCCGIREPRPDGPGCLRAAEPAALATASPLPSLDGGLPRRYRPLADRTSRCHKHLSGKRMARDGPYRSGHAPMTVPEAGLLRQETAAGTSFAPVHHLRRSRRVGRTAASAGLEVSPSLRAHVRESYPHLSCLALSCNSRGTHPADRH